MPLLSLFDMALIASGILLWLINNEIPIPQKIKKSLNITLGVGLAIWLLYAFGSVTLLVHSATGR